MGKRQRLNSHRRTQSHHVTFLFSPFPPFPLLSFHPSLPHIHAPVINLVEISCSLINACPHLFLSPSLSFSIVSDSGFFFLLCLLSVAFFSVFFADENEVMCSVRGVRQEDWVGPPSIPSGTVSNADSESLTTEYDGLNSCMNS